MTVNRSKNNQSCAPPIQVVHSLQCSLEYDPLNNFRETDIILQDHLAELYLRACEFAV